MNKFNMQIKILSIIILFCIPAYTMNCPLVLNGIDVLEKENFKPIVNKKIGLITNHTGRNCKGINTIDVLYNARGVKLIALFSPEHGIRGDQDREGIESGMDKKTGLLIYSLYGQTKHPTPEMLKDIDALIFDIQDIGTRFYTYITTMGYCMEEAAKNNIDFFVLDRINPINGKNVEGDVLDIKIKHFAGYYSIPIRHGMTVGEIANYYNKKFNIGAKLTVIKILNWKRDMWLDETGIKWINTSPNMRSLTAATLYPGIGCFEATNISVGRGTDKPFEYIGAPWLDGEELAKRMNNLNLAGIKFKSVTFTPDASLYKGKKCSGLNIEITDRTKLKITEVFIYMVSIIKQLHPDNFKYSRLEAMIGTNSVTEMLDKNLNPSVTINEINIRLSNFIKERENFLLYKN